MTVKVFPTVNAVGGLDSGKALKEANLIAWLKQLIAQNFIVSGFTVPSSSANLTLSVALGQACIDGRRVDIDTATTVTCTANATNHIYLKLTKDASQNVTGAVFEVNTTGTAPADSVKIATAVTSGTAVTSTTDVRQFNTPYMTAFRNLLDPATQKFTRSSVAYKKDGTQVSANTLRLEQGKFGQAPFVEEGTSNLLSANQSSVETDTTGFGANNSATLSRDTANFFSGTASLKIITGNIAASEGCYIGNRPAASAATVYSGQARIKGTNGVILRVYLRAIDSAQSTVLGSKTTDIILDGNWQLVKVENFTTPANTAYIDMVVVTTVQIGTTFYIDCLQIEQKAYATSWQIGGTARTADRLYYTLAQPLPKQNFGALVWTPEQSSSQITRDMTLMEIGNGTGGAVRRYRMFFQGSTKKFCFGKSTTGLTSGFVDVTSAVTTFNARDSIFIAWFDDPITGTMKLWVGINNGTLAEYTLANTDQITDANTVFVGCFYTSSYEANGTIDFPILSDVLPTSAQVEALYRAQDWGGMRNYPGILSAETKTPTGGTFWHSENDGAGSSLSADDTDGYHANTGTVANTIPVRDGSGNLPGNITGNAATATSAGNADTVDGKHAINLLSDTNLAQDVLSTGKLQGILTTLNRLIHSNLPEQSFTNTAWADIKTYSFTKTAAHKKLYVTFDGHSSSSISGESADARIVINGVEKQLWTSIGTGTNFATYVTYAATIDLSGYADGTTINFALQGKTGNATYAGYERNLYIYTNDLIDLVRM